MNVGIRYALAFAWNWAEEAMLFLMIVAVFAGAVATWRGDFVRNQAMARP